MSCLLESLLEIANAILQGSANDHRRTNFGVFIVADQWLCPYTLFIGYCLDLHEYIL